MMVTRRAWSSRAHPGLRRLVALMHKEWIQMVRDPSSILIAVVMPLILLFLFGYGVNLDATHTSLGVVLEDPGPEARELAAAFELSPYFEVRLATDRRELEQLLTAGKVRGIVVIPATFEAALRKGSHRPDLQILLDGSDPNTAALVEAYVQGVVANWSVLRSEQTGSTATAAVAADRLWFNPARTSMSFLVPGSVAIVMALVGTLLTALVVAREWERGTMEALLATPVSGAELILGKLLPYYLLGLTSMTVCTLFAVFLFGVPFRGSVIALYAISSAFLVPALGLGLLISAATRNQLIASQLALLSSFMPTVLLSGFLFEIDSMPKFIQLLCQLVPARWLVPSLQTVFLVGDLWSLFATHIAVLALFGVVFLFFAVKAMRRQVA